MAIALLITGAATGTKVGVSNSLSDETPKNNVTNAGHCHCWINEAVETTIERNLSSHFTE